MRTPLTCIHQYVTLLLDGLAAHWRRTERPLEVGAAKHQSIARDDRDLGSTRRTAEVAGEPRCVDMANWCGSSGMMSQTPRKTYRSRMQAGSEFLVYADPDRTLEFDQFAGHAVSSHRQTAGGVTGSLWKGPQFGLCSVSDSGRHSADSLSQVFDRSIRTAGVDGTEWLGWGSTLRENRSRMAKNVGASDADVRTFSFTLRCIRWPNFSSVITHHGRLRKDIVLCGWN